MSREDLFTDNEEFDTGEIVEKFYKMNKNINTLKTEILRISKKVSLFPATINTSIEEHEQRTQTLSNQMEDGIHKQEEHFKLFITEIKQEKDRIKNILQDIQTQMVNHEKYVVELINETEKNKDIQQKFYSDLQPVLGLDEAVKQLQSHLNNLSTRLKEREERDSVEKDQRGDFLNDLQQLIQNQQEDIDYIKSYIEADKTELEKRFDREFNGIDQRLSDLNQLILGNQAEMVGMTKERDTADDETQRLTEIKEALERLENMTQSFHDKQEAIKSINDNDEMVEIIKELSPKSHERLEQIPVLLNDFHSKTSQDPVEKDQQKNEIAYHTSIPETPQQKEVIQPNKPLVKENSTFYNEIQKRPFPQFKAKENEVPFSNTFSNGVHFRSLQQVDLKKIRPVNGYTFNQMTHPPALSEQQTRTEDSDVEKAAVMLDKTTNMESNESDQNESSAPYLKEDSNHSLQESKDLNNSDWLFEEKSKGIKEYLASVFSFRNKDKKNEV